jgi:hypothetical protein
MYDVIVVTNYFRPDSFRINEVVDAFVADGKKVLVVTGRPLYRPWNDKGDGQIVGRIVATEFSYDQIILNTIGRNWSKFKSVSLFAHYLSYWANIPLLVWVLVRYKVRALNVIVYMVSPPTILLMGVIVYLVARGRSLRYWIQDLWPEALRCELNSGILYFTLGSLVNIYLKLLFFVADSIFCNSSNMEQILRARFKGAVKKSYTLLTPALPSPFPNRNLSQTPPHRLCILFLGNVGGAQNLVAAAIACFDIANELGCKLSFTVIGSPRGVSEPMVSLESEIISRGGYFDVVEWMTESDLSNIGVNFDFGLVSLIESLEAVIPAKVGTYLNMGLPILSFGCTALAEPLSHWDLGVDISLGLEKPQGIDLSKVSLRVDRLRKADPMDISRRCREWLESDFSLSKCARVLSE